MAKPAKGKTPTSEILATIEEVRVLQDTVAKHTELLEKLAGRLEKLEAQLGAGEGGSARPAP